MAQQESEELSGPDVDSLSDIYTHYRLHPESGKEVPGRFLWTASAPDAPEFPNVLVCNPSPTELISPLSVERSDAMPLAAVGALVEPTLEEAKRLEEGPGILSLRAVCDRYANRCVCGTTYQDNCAHFLSNAFILAGYSDLLTSSIITARCPQRRPIRAQDMLRWFQARQTGFLGSRIQRNTGIWATYQETSGWRHVVVIDTNRWLYYGTGDYHTWPVQWNYRIP
jgi:hypothetical protein